MQRVFSFGKGRSDGHKGMKGLVSMSISSSIYIYIYIWVYTYVYVFVQLGGKGANLAEMACIGLSVPPGLTISTEACQEYQQIGKRLPEGLWEEALEALKMVEKEMGATLGDPSKPLLLSVRSGAAVSLF